MKNFHRSIGRVRRATAAGFSLVEVMISVGIMTVIMAATMTALSQAMKANETAVLVTGMNNSLRTAMDLMIRDLLQVGSGLPPGHFILIPSNSQMNMPGPPLTPAVTYKSVVGDLDINAVNPGYGLGPVVSGIATDMITTLAADSTFTHVALKSLATDGTIVVDPAVDISTGPDKVMPGQLIMLEKGSYSVLMQVTAIDGPARRITFGTSPQDSLNLNKPNAPSGSVNGAAGLIAWPTSPDTVPIAPALFLTTTATRIRMISYYIDNTKPAHPKLVRRINNGNPTSFDNTSGSTVAFDVDNLQISYDIANGTSTLANQRCAPLTCSVNQIRKVNITLGARSRSVYSVTRQFFHNTLTTQVSLRGMAFVNEYAPPI